ncbi:Membrane protein insertase YidC [Buchnera aphidicola (Eriosoma lanigerum)]|uniref:membrane protein insertase YidC n=1 Tax=Buchnera aphidicola TaxID=9 RepID=UPI0034643A24
MNLLKRNFFTIIFIFITFILWNTWNNNELKITNEQHEKSYINIHTKKNYSFVNKKKYVNLRNDVISVTINQFGGDIEKVILLKYKDKLYSSKCFHLLDTTSNFIYHAQSGLIGENGPDNSIYKKRPFYKTTSNIFELNKNSTELTVPFIWKDTNGVEYVKSFTLQNGKYYITVKHIIKNNTKKPLLMSVFGQLKQTIKLPNQKNTNFKIFSLHTYRGAAYSTENTKYKKYDFNAINKLQSLSITTNHGWIAMIQQYFISAWIPNIPKINVIYTKSVNNHSTATIGYKSESIYIAPFTNYTFKSNIWIGPTIQDHMVLIAPYLNLTTDYGMFWWLSQPLFKLLKFFYTFIGNWGGAIIAITLLIRAIMYPFTKSQYISMIKMRKIQPKIDQIKKQYNENKQKISKEIILLYKKEKINPLKGFLPLFIQMPIFLALYYMLINAIELRHAPFIFWIHDLSDKDPYYILPILMGITMLITQYISPNIARDPLQKKIMNIIPIGFTIFFLWFPSGLVLYYIISNIVTIIQQKIIYYGLKDN